MTAEQQLADLKDRIERLAERYEGDLRGLVVRAKTAASTPPSNELREAAEQFRSYLNGELATSDGGYNDGIGCAQVAFEEVQQSSFSPLEEDENTLPPPCFTTGTLSGDLRELAKLIRDQTEQDWIGVTESNSVNETLESAQAWRHNCRAYAEGVEQAAGYIEDDGLAEAGRSVIADRLAEQLANGVPPEEIEWPEAWANLAREIKKYGGGSRD